MWGHGVPRDKAKALVLGEIGVPTANVAVELAAMEHVTIGATASRAVLGCMNDTVHQLGAYPRGARGKFALREAALYLSENIYSFTDFAQPWLKALELFGVVAGRPVTVHTRMWH